MTESEIKLPPSRPPRHRLLNLETYRRYFQVKQEEVLTRIIKSLTPWKRNFFETDDNSPDLYGPFWIMTTIVFLLACMGNLSRYLNDWDNDGFIFRIHLVRYAILVVYGVGFGLPLALGLLLRYFRSETTIAQLVCLYGYSLGCFVAILPLCVVPSNLLQWLLISYGVLNSTAFLILNLDTEMLTLDSRKKYFVYGLIAGCQFGLWLMVKLLFFDLVIEAGDQGDVDPADTPDDDTDSG